MNTQIEQNIAKNIQELRKAYGMKQSELGEKISYSDKTISKWENGFSVPDITALSSLAEIFDVTIDDLTKENAVLKISDQASQQYKEFYANKIATLCLAVVSVFTVAVLIYVGVEIIKGFRFWQVFIWAVPPASFIVYRYNKANRNIKWANTVLLSLFAWGLITASYLQLLEYNLWHLFLLGAPLQAMIIINTLLRKKHLSTKKFTPNIEVKTSAAKNKGNDSSDKEKCEEKKEK